MVYYFKSEKEAYAIARGKKPSVTLVQYYEAWQYLYDTHSDLMDESDLYYMDKLICDGSVLTSQNYNELGGIPYIPYGMGAWREITLTTD